MGQHDDALRKPDLRLALCPRTPSLRLRALRKSLGLDYDTGQIQARKGRI